MRPSRLALILNSAAAFLALMVLSGWAFDIAIFRSLIPGFPAMVPMTAVCILSLGFAGILSAVHSRKAGSTLDLRPAIFLVALFPCVIGSFALCVHSFELSSDWFRLFEIQSEARQQEILFDGLMSVQTSLLSLWTGLAMILRLSRRSLKVRSLIQILPLASLSICGMGLIGYVHDISINGPSKLIGISLVSAISFICLSVAVFALDAEVGVLRRMRGESSDAFFLRWFVALSLFVPVITSALIRGGESLSFYPAAFSMTLLVSFTIACLLILGIFLARAIRQSEQQQLAIQRSEARAALRESEESLKETKDRLEIALATSKMGTWETELGSGQTICSPLTEEILGLAPGSFGGGFESFIRLVHPADVERFMTARTQAVQNGTDFDIDFRVIWKDGSTHWLRQKGRLKPSENGSPARLTGTVMDVTAEISYQEALEKALQAAESANQLKTSFLANMSHEIRTPLAAILGFTDLLADPEATLEERSRYLKVVSRNGKMLSQILNDILDLSKVESGHLNVEILRFRVRELVEEVTSLLKPNAAEKNVELRVKFDETVPAFISTDPVRLKQILMNLVGNAIKFTSSGWVGISVSVSKDKVFFEIEDTGIGIDAEKQAKLFQPFSQADDSMTRRFGGSGLGLLLSRRLALLLGGNVELARSVAGQGSLFVASVSDAEALALRSIEVSEKDAALPRRRLDGIQILLIEDSADNRQLISRLLTKEGAEVSVAFDGEEGLRAAQDSVADLILMDIQMPVMDGFTATRILRSRNDTRPIIALTAHAMNDVRQKCEEVGCDAHLAKPIDLEQLIQTISNLVAGKSGSSRKGSPHDHSSSP